MSAPLDRMILVPREPTAEMLRAADGISSRVGDGPSRGIHWPPAVGPEDVWHVMIEAWLRSK